MKDAQDQLLTQPKFQVYGPKTSPTVWLLCTFCDKKIRRLVPKESIKVNQAYFCEEHDPGRVIQNPSRESS